jgi:uncharacterized phiE125 gp8 family phage protein
MTLTLIDGGDELAIPIDDIRTALRIEHTSEDSVIERAAIAAAEFFEEETLRTVSGVSTYELALDDWPCGPVVLERAPVREVVSVTYLPRDGGPAEELEADLDLRLRADKLSELRVVGGWPTSIGLASRGGNVLIRFTAGYAPRKASEGEARFRLPAKYEQALILLTGHWFENREESTDRRNEAIVMGARRIIQQARIFR